MGIWKMPKEGGNLTRQGGGGYDRVGGEGPGSLDERGDGIQFLEWGKEPINMPPGVTDCPKIKREKTKGGCRTTRIRGEDSASKLLNKPWQKGLKTLKKGDRGYQVAARCGGGWQTRKSEDEKVTEERAGLTRRGVREKSSSLPERVLSGWAPREGPHLLRAARNLAPRAKRERGGSA